MERPVPAEPRSGQRAALTRRRFLQAGTALVALPALPALCRVADDGPPRHPNVLLVLSDSHRASSTGCYGDRVARTPGFDAFARQGLRLTTAISNTPVCRPYRASLMSGLLAHRHGLLSNDAARNPGMTEARQWIRPELPKLAATFGAAGYRCGYVGKWHLGPPELAQGAARLGFDDLWFVAKDPQEYERWTYVTDAGDMVSGQGRFRPAVEVDKALEFIAANLRLPSISPSVPSAGDSAAPPPRPWFLVVSWGPPHEPLEPPAEFLEHFADPVVLPPNISDPRARRLAAKDLPRYLALIEGIDQQFARLLDELGRLGVADETIVVYTSDHGNQMYSHDMTGKGVPYSESTRVPFLVRWPDRIAAGATLGMPLGAPDVGPTLLGLAGLEPPAGLDGRDGSAVLLGDPLAARTEALYLSAFDVGVLDGKGWRGLRTERHLYARTEAGPWLLFDCREDPFEQRNLVDVDAKLRKELDERTLELMGELGDSW